MTRTVWERRFGGREAVPALEAFNASIGSDVFLLDAELKATGAYARALKRAGMVSAAERDAILSGLERVAERVAAGENLGRFEDVHTAVELLLVEEAGEAGRRIHTGRSRNEQVATDERLWLKGRIPELADRVSEIQRALLALAENHPEAVMPGYTHLQQAQPILFAHWAMSYFWPLERGKDRLREALHRVDALPLGSGALAGTSVPLDRGYLAELLGFGACTENSLDAVSDRSFILETLFALAVILLDLSRLAEDVVLFATEEFGFLRLDASVATSSSLMPQKKNPDVFELLRAAPARLFGELARLFIVLKGLPGGYDKDLQEDKEPLRRGVEDAARILEVAALALRRVSPDPDRMESALNPGVFATDLADYLVARGVAFRDAHGIVGDLVRRAGERGVALNALPEAELAAGHPVLGREAAAVFDPRRSVAAKRTPGSTNPGMVREQLERAKRLLG